jgi:hypothetical protein
MDWGRQVFSYCERGLDPSFWAEPLNAISNAAFLVAAAVALVLWLQQPADRRGAFELGLIVTVGIIGVGSFLFHTFATRWAMLADVIPITVFMIVFLGYALSRFVGLGWLGSLAGLALFVGALFVAESWKCGSGACLNGSVGYLPALAVLALIGGWLRRRSHPVANLLLAGSALFALSLVFRTIDRAICPVTSLSGGRALGTHFLWHICNAGLLFLLMVAAVRHGRRTPPSTD